MRTVPKYISEQLNNTIQTIANTSDCSTRMWIGTMPRSYASEVEFVTEEVPWIF